MTNNTMTNDQFSMTNLRWVQNPLPVLRHRWPPVAHRSLLVIGHTAYSLHVTVRNELWPRAGMDHSIPRPGESSE